MNFAIVVRFVSCAITRQRELEHARKYVYVCVRVSMCMYVCVYLYYYARTHEEICVCMCVCVSMHVKESNHKSVQRLVSHSTHVTGYASIIDFFFVHHNSPRFVAGITYRLHNQDSQLSICEAV